MSDVTNLKPRYLYVGDTAPDYEATIRDANGDLKSTSGWTVVGGSVRFTNLETGAVVLGTGVLSIPSSGNFTYAWAVADTAVAGNYDILVRLDTTGGSKFATLKDRRGLVIKALPV